MDSSSNTLESTREIRSTFDLIDTSHDGLIDPDELRCALNSLGFEFTAGEIKRLVMELDPQNTGTIDFQHFSELIHQKMSEREKIEEIQYAFQMFDSNRTGKITFADLKRVAKELGEELTDQELHEMINEADTDNDGEISFEEFVALVRAAAFA